MSEARVAARYATSLFDLALEQNILDQVMADAQVFINTCNQNHGFELMLKSPIILADKKWHVMSRLFAPTFQKTTMSFIHIVLKKKREYVMYQIFMQFADMYREHKGIVIATVYTAMPVSDQIKEDINLFLKNKTQKTVQLQTSVEPELIGGFVLRFEDKLLDASVSTQLNSLRHHLIHNN